MLQDIIRLPRNLRFLQRPLAQFISSVRAPKSAEGYAAIGGGSPLRRITNDQAQALQESLEKKGCPAHVYVGKMCAGHPLNRIGSISLSVVSVDCCDLA